MDSVSHRAFFSVTCSSKFSFWLNLVSDPTLVNRSRLVATGPSDRNQDRCQRRRGHQQHQEETVTSMYLGTNNKRVHMQRTEEAGGLGAAQFWPKCFLTQGLSIRLTEMAAETRMYIYPGITRRGGAVSGRQCSQYQVSPLPLWASRASTTRNSGSQ